MFRTPGKDPLNVTSETSCSDGLMDFDKFSEQSRIKKWLRYFLFIRPIVHLFHGYVLDIGCGPGVYLEHYSGPSLGIDAHPNNIKICKMKGIQAIECDANSFLQEGVFDTVLVSHVLEHLDDPSRVIENAYKNTKYGGRIIIIVPCYEGFISGMNDLVGHKKFISEEYISKEMGRLTCRKIRSCTFPPLFGGKYQELRMIFKK